MVGGSDARATNRQKRMKPSTLVIMVLGASSAISLGAAEFYRQSTLESEAALSRVAQSIATLDFRVRRLKAQIGAMSESTAQPAVKRHAEHSHPPLVAAAGAKFVLTTPSLLAMVQSDPKQFASAADNRRMISERKYASLFRSLKFDSEHVAKFESLESLHAKALVDIAASATENGVPLDDPAVNELIAREFDQYRDAQRAFLGEDGFEKLKQFARLIPVTKFVQQLATSVALSSAPLSSQQGDELSQVFANASSSYRAGGSATESTVDWGIVMASARPILDPAQFAALQDQRAAVQVYDMEKQFMDRELETPP